MEKKKISIIMTTAAFAMAASAAGDFAIILDRKDINYNIAEWELVNKYSPWINIGDKYDCVATYYNEDVTYFKDEDCLQNQERTFDEYKVEKHTGQEELISTGQKETQTIMVNEVTEVGHVTVSSLSGSFNVNEGNVGSNNEIDLKITLNKPFTSVLEYSYNTQDITTSSVLDKAEHLVYDEFGNPFISVVDNAKGGKLIFDAGFPKYYNTNWNGATDFNGMGDQFKFMHNIVKWIGEEHKERGKVLIYGDAIEGSNYSVHESASSDFNNSIPSTVSIAGFTPVIKEASHPDFNGSKAANRKVNMTLDEMNKYSAIIVMSSGGWDSLTTEAVNNFTTYVNNGGGVYIITDHDYFQRTGNQLLRKFGSEFYGVVNRTGGHNAYKLSTIWSNLSGTEYGQGHPLWSGLNASDYIPAGGSEGNVRLFTPQTDIVAKGGILRFEPGETEKVVTIKINGDNIKEPNEKFKFMIQAGNDGYVEDNNAAKEITIIDDD